MVKTKEEDRNWQSNTGVVCKKSLEHRIPSAFPSGVLTATATATSAGILHQPVLHFFVGCGLYRHENRCKGPVLVKVHPPLPTWQNVFRNRSLLIHWATPVVFLLKTLPYCWASLLSSVVLDGLSVYQDTLWGGSLCLESFVLNISFQWWNGQS